MQPRPAETAALGLLQGPAELLPVSSSAHVELLPWLLGWSHARLPGERRKEVEVALHAGTAVALCSRARAALRWPLPLAALPPAIAGLALERPIERHLGGPRSIAAGLVAGSVALVVTDRAAPADRGRTADTAGVGDALWLGVAQAAALWPGVSRSAATRSAARARGFSRAASAELSADVALPVLAGASVLKGARLVQRRDGWPPLAAGAAAAAVSTAGALRLRLFAGVPPAGWAAYRCGLAAVILTAARRRRRAGAATVLAVRQNRER